MSPRLSASVPAVDRCPDNSTNPAIQPDQYIDADATPVPGDIEKLGFRLGDQICFRLRIDFDTDVQTRNAVVTDFVPLGTEYVDGTVHRDGSEHSGVHEQYVGVRAPRVHHR